MSRDLLLVALPYASVAIFLAGTIWRFRSARTISSQSSQFLERRWLAWGTIPFHFGIFVVLADHLVPLVAPDMWRVLVSKPWGLLAVESLGAGGAMLALLGLTILLLRRLGTGVVRASSSFGDIAVVVLLIAQAALGFAVASLHRWGSVWSVGTTVPYLRSLLAFNPDVTYVAGVPPLMQWHLAGAWIILALLPFTRLVHMLTFPLGYLFRRPQKVVWTT